MEQKEQASSKTLSLISAVRSLESVLKAHIDSMILVANLNYNVATDFPEIFSLLDDPQSNVSPPITNLLTGAQHSLNYTHNDTQSNLIQNLLVSQTNDAVEQNLETSSNPNNLKSQKSENEIYEKSSNLNVWSEESTPPLNRVHNSSSSSMRIKSRKNSKIASGISAESSIVTRTKNLKREKIYLSIRVIFMKIGIIDTIHDRYTAEVLIQSKWREPNLDGSQIKTIENWDKLWNPRLTVENIIGESKMNVTHSVIYDIKKKATVCESLKVYGQFFEFMELNQFPFDHQDLTVTIVSENDIDRLDFTLDPIEKCGINAQAFSAEQEWSLEQNVSTWKRTISKTVNKVVIDYPGLCVAAKANRRPQFFIWNIIVIMMAICSLAFATFTVNLETPQFRLQLTYILLLTTVTFKFVVNKSLPKISYLTYLDKYILGSMVILCGICIWHALIGSIIYNSLPRASLAPVVVTTINPVINSSLSQNSSLISIQKREVVQHLERHSNIIHSDRLVNHILDLKMDNFSSDIYLNVLKQIFSKNIFELENNAIFNYLINKDSTHSNYYNSAEEINNMQNIIEHLHKLIQSDLNKYFIKLKDLSNMISHILSNKNKEDFYFEVKKLTMIENKIKRSLKSDLSLFKKLTIVNNVNLSKFDSKTTMENTAIFNDYQPIIQTQVEPAYLLQFDTLNTTTMSIQNMSTTHSPPVVVTSKSPGPTCILVDKIALAVLSFIYIAFHLFFLLLIWKSRREDVYEHTSTAANNPLEIWFRS